MARSSVEREKSRARSRKHGIAEQLPYETLLDDYTIRLRDGSLVRGFHLESLSGRTDDSLHASMAEIRDRAIRVFNSGNYLVYHHVIRRYVASGEAPPSADNDEPTSSVDAREVPVAGEFLNEHFICVVRRRPETGGGFSKIIQRKIREWGRRAPDSDIAVARDEFHALSGMLTAALRDVEARPLGSYEARTGTCSELLALLSCLYNNEMCPALKTDGDIGAYLPYRRVSFGFEAIRQISADNSTDFVSAVSAKGHTPSAAVATICALLKLPSEMTLIETYGIAEEPLQSGRRPPHPHDNSSKVPEPLNRPFSDWGGQETASETERDLTHHFSAFIRAPSLSQLSRATAECLGALADIGVVAVREDINLEHAFWAQFPGNERFITRKSQSKVRIGGESFEALMPTAGGHREVIL